MFASNPIYARLGKPARRDNWIALGALILIGGVMAFTVPGMSVCASMLPCVFGLIMPIALAGTASNITARYAASEDYQLLRITSVDPMTIVRGFMLVSLDRGTLAYSMILASIPVALRDAVRQIVEMISHPLPYGDTRFVLMTVWAVVGMPGNLLMAGALGVWLGLRWREPPVTALMSSAALFVYTLVGFFCMMLFGTLPPDIPIIVVRVILLLGLIVLPWLTGIFFLRLAEHHV
jgi:hypothetical protein